MSVWHNPVPACRSGAAYRNDRGVALVIVLWMLMLLTIIASGIALTARTEAQVASNLVAQAQAEAAADAAIHRAIAMLLTTVPAAVVDPQRWQSDGLERQWTFGEASVRVLIRDESAKVDLNNAPATLFAGLFRAAGLSDSHAEALADAVIDWRDPDDLRSLHGAERGEYTAAGKAYGPANASFDSVEELRLVLGMNEEIFRAVRRFVTVHSQSPTINAATADRTVLLALPGATPSQVDAYVEQRRRLQERGLPPPPFALAPGSSSSLNYYSIQAQANLGDNASFWREAVVWLPNNASSPFLVLAWRALWPDAQQTINSVSAP